MKEKLMISVMIVLCVMAFMSNDILFGICAYSACYASYFLWSKPVKDYIKYGSNPDCPETVGNADYD